jgi:hypothetical protein
MVAGLAEVVETKRFFGCGGLQPSELFGAAIWVGTYPSRRIARVQGHRMAITSV